MCIFRTEVHQNHTKSVECAGQIGECAGQIVECAGQIVECAEQIVECAGQIVGCAGQIVECAGQIVECAGQISSTPKLNMAFSALPLTKLVIPEWHVMAVCMHNWSQAGQEIGKLVYKFVYGSKYSMAVTKPISNKFLIIRQVVVTNSDTEFH